MVSKIDPSGMPDKLRVGVERAARLLEIELEKLSPYVIEADWRVGSFEVGGLSVNLTLTALDESEPVSDSTTFHPGYFMSDNPEATSNSLRNLVSRFADRLRAILRKDVRQIRTQLSQMAPVVGE